MNPLYFQKRVFGILPDKREVTEYSLSNRHGMRMSVMDYGCTITSLMTADSNDVFENVVLGFDTLEQYLTSPHYMGCIVGRCAGRIANGQLNINGHTYPLSINQSPHHLHGGVHGFHTKTWSAIPFENEEGVGIQFSYMSPDQEEGYPGNLAVEVRYFLSHSNTLSFQYKAHTDAPTVVNLTQHTYFNLGGGHTSILKQALAINADAYLPISNSKVPTGEILDVHGSVFDFRQPILIGHVLTQPDPQLQLARGIDHCFVIRAGEHQLSHAAVLIDTSSGRRMDVFTTEPGLQVYTGNYLEGTGKKGVTYGPFSGIALETQHYPDAVHHPGFPSVILLPGETYDSVTLLKFSTI